MKKSVLCSILALCVVLSAVFTCGFSLQAQAEPAANQFAQETVEGGAILHCFNWSYNSIKANLADIAAAGYTAVQTSPVQQPKDYDASYTSSSTEWWKLYQPLGLSIADGGTWLGTKAELAALCEEAETYGIKVIVDIVANHLANSGTSGGTIANLSPDVEAALRSADYYHTDPNGVGDGSRYEMTQRHLGMPDLNTGNAYIQKRVLNLLKECVDLGVDGFRFDAAKHIELPTDPDGVKSDFWPTVINGINEYSESDVYCYGEILYNAGTEIQNYTQYIDITDSVSSGEARSGAANANAGQLADGRYLMGEAPDDAVLWVESHDTYEDGSTSGISDDKIVKAWAIVGARADSTALFLARPNDVMGEASSDNSWKSDAVAEVNKFKNFFEDTSEYISYDQDAAVTYIERGSNGVVISRLNGAGSVSLPVHQMADGTYKDQITGNTFTVSAGTIGGNVGSTGVAVVYNVEDAPEDDPNGASAYYLFGYINGANYGCEGDWENLGEYKFVGGKVTARFTQDSYVGVKSADNASWYMTDGWQGQVSSVTLYNSNDLGSDANKLYVPANTKVTFTLTKGENDTFTLSYEEAPIDYYLFGYINGANYGCEEDYQNLGAYKFVDGKVTARFTQDSYVGVKDEYNENWYMTDGWQGQVSSATLYNSQNLDSNANKLYVPANTKVTFTLEPGANDTFTLSYEETPVDYYLFGYINGGDYGCESDWQTLGAYKFVNGQLTTSFLADSYVAVKDEYCESWYMTDGWQGQVSSVTLYNTLNLGTDANKLFVPANTRVTFTLTPGENDTFTLSYVPAALRGDIDGNGAVEISDVTALLNILAGQAAADGVDIDLDGNGQVNISDVTVLLDILANA